MDSELRIYPREKYESDLRKELEVKGLYRAIEQRADEISEVTSDLGYVEHRYIQEILSEILDLLKVTGEKKWFIGADCASCPVEDVNCYEQCRQDKKRDVK